jgi:PAS domain S-box-containing protein
MLLNTTPRRDANGEITGMVGVGQDVTDRNKAEVEKARMASDTRIILDAASVPIWAIDKEGRINAWNKRSEELVGYTSDEAMGLLASDFALPEWRARIQSVLEDALKGISTVNYEHPMYNQAGERLDMLLSTTPLLDASNGEITGVVSVCHDVTNRKKAEAVTAQMASEMRRLIDTANAPIFGIDKEGRVNAWNKKSAELAGYTSDEVMGRDLVQEFISPEYRVAVKEVLDNALKGLVTSSFEFPLFSKAGIPIQLLLNANPRRNDIGNIVGVVGVGQDLTEERKAMKTEVDLIKVIYRNHN